MNLVYLEYHFDDKEHKINFNRIRGNAKGQQIEGNQVFSERKNKITITRC